ERRPGRDARLLRGRAVVAGRLEPEQHAILLHRGWEDLRRAPDSAGACFSRNDAIQRAPHSSRPSRRSPARTASTHSGERESIIALSSPWLCAIERTAPPRVLRRGRPNAVFEAPQVVLTPRCSRISASVSMKSV